jgi:DNA-directed RNA polymerase specialized sigma24 family protein
MILGAMYAAQLGEVEQRVKAERLSRCGFSNPQIAEILGTTTNTVNVALHRARKGAKSSSKKARKRV